MTKIKVVMTCAGKPEKNIFSTLDSTKYDFIQVSDEKSEDEVIEDIKDADAVYLAGDIACRTTDAWNRTDNIAYRSLIDFFEKGSCQHLVNPEYKKHLRQTL